MKVIEVGIGRARAPQSGLVVVVDDQVIEFAAAVASLASAAAAPPASLGDVLADWDQWSDRLLDIKDLVRADRERVPGLGPVVDVTMDAPVVPDALLLFAAANYAAHAAEAEESDRVGATVGTGPTDPYMFLKPSRSVVGPTDPVIAPSDAQMVDWEVELGAVIGRAGRRIPAESAMDHVAGYTICNDVSARDHVQRQEWPFFSSDWFAQKGYDTFTPIGPVIVPAAAVADPYALGLRLWVDDELKQDAVASDMVFDIAAQIEFASRFATLRPGDIISTGTPAGVGMATGRYLAAGETMRAEIDGLGRQRSLVVSEDSEAEPHGQAVARASRTR